MGLRLSNSAVQTTLGISRLPAGAVSPAEQLVADTIHSHCDVIDSKDLACKEAGNMAANSLEVTELAQQVGQGQEMSTVADIVFVALHERAAIRS